MSFLRNTYDFLGGAFCMFGSLARDFYDSIKYGFLGEKSLMRKTRGDDEERVCDELNDSNVINPVLHIKPIDLSHAGVCGEEGDTSCFHVSGGERR